MQSVHERQRKIDRRASRIGEFRPELFVIGLDRRFVFRHRQPKARIAVHVAIGEMMDDLPHRPTLGAIGRVQLRIRQPAHGLPQALRCFCDVADPGGAALRRGVDVSIELADRIAQINHGSS